jgi:cytochrome c-type biogenesis protein
VLVPSLLFVSSFSVIFILLGLGATGIGSTLQKHQVMLDKVAAVLIIAMGLFFISALFIPQFNREWHVEGLLERAGTGGPLVAGAAFGIAWTPCIGPTLAAILSAAAVSGSAAHGAFLLAVYSAGLAIPFLLTSLAFSRMTTAFAVIKRHYPLIMAIGGVILIAFGVAILTGWFNTFNHWAQDLLNSAGINVSSDI